MTDKAEFERLLDVYGFRCERFGQDLSTHARAQVVSAFTTLASAPVAGVATIYLDAGHLREVLAGNDMPVAASSEPGRGMVPLRPAIEDDDPFGFGAAVLQQIETDTLDSLEIPDILPEDGV